ncbi:MAG: hypothetical protein COV73_02765 [Candidatus Omnitrophica bacterium CG11_big_fil_rev_8_21_14_0_20_43_6]|nr:MAG: hypothetical protein COV73_02765 [Candidatus Omnitrophica bacterium CG11_big_fil_rev_8_21_14_0_20_43_6]
MKKIIIIGAGFAGLKAAQRLSGSGLELEITLLDKKGKFNFLPLLPDCIGRQINPEFLVNELARLCRNPKVKFIQEEVSCVDLAAQQIRTAQAAYVYDYLLIASGSQPNFFSNPAVQTHGYPLNNVADTQKIIRSLKENDPENLIICGAGYTGVEVAANLWRYFKKKGLSRKIVVVERMPEILGALPGWVKDYVVKNLAGMRIEIFTNSVIEAIEPDKLSVSGGRQFRRAMLIWVPGVRTAQFIQELKVPQNLQGRIMVDEYLRVSRNCFCAGDAAFFKKNDSFLRMAVKFAITQGDQAAKNITRSIKNIPLEKYRTLDLGYIIPMANNKSCGRALGLNVSGRPATFLHFIMCIFRSIGWKNKAGIISNLIKAALALSR